MRRVRLLAILPVLVLIAGCGSSSPKEQDATSYAIYGEYATSNKLMQPGLNRRVFNKVEAQSGSDIHLNKDGSIELDPGTYHLTGFSITTMQTTFAPPQAKHNDNYPGYAVVYPAADENSGKTVMQHLVAIGSPQNALDTTPSTFDAVYTTKAKTSIAVGHQSGSDLHNEVYLDVYDVAGQKSNDHVFARIDIQRLR